MLSFREVPVILKVFQSIRSKPDLLLCDGQGLAHPRRFGLACHLGLLLNLPAIGCAKSLLIGTSNPVAPERGRMEPLWDRGEQVGWTLRARTGVKPIYISPGHRVTMEEIPGLVMECTPRFRIPEPIRMAHRLVNDTRKKYHFALSLYLT